MNRPVARHSDVVIDRIEAKALCGDAELPRQGRTAPHRAKPRALLIADDRARLLAMPMTGERRRRGGKCNDQDGSPHGVSFAKHDHWSRAERSRSTPPRSTHTD